MKFKVIYADPPWEFRTYSSKGKGRSPEQHYPCMTLADIKALPMSCIAEENCMLFLWATNPLKPVAFDVLDSWGFEYKSTAFTWIKPTKLGKHWHMGNGYYTRQNTEQVLLAVRGRGWRVSKSVREVVDDPVMEHSRKPACVRDRIVQLCGDVSRIELFARERTPGWLATGFDVDGCDIREILPRLAER